MPTKTKSNEKMETAPKAAAAAAQGGDGCESGQSESESVWIHQLTLLDESESLIGCVNFLGNPERH